MHFHLYLLAWQASENTAWHVVQLLAMYCCVSKANGKESVSLIAPCAHFSPCDMSVKCCWKGFMLYSFLFSPEELVNEWTFIATGECVPGTLYSSWLFWRTVKKKLRNMDCSPAVSVGHALQCGSLLSFVVVLCSYACCVTDLWQVETIASFRATGKETCVSKRWVDSF